MRNSAGSMSSFLAISSDHRLGGELGDRGAGRAVGGHLGPVDHHVVAFDIRILDIVGREDAHAAGPDRRAGEGAGLIGDPGLGSGELAVLGGAHLDGHGAARGRAAGAEDLFPRHHHLDRPAGDLGEPERERLQVDHGLAAEAAADLRRRHADVGEVDAEQGGAVGAHGELPLGAAPYLALPVLAGAGDHRVGLDIALMHRLGGEGALDDDIGLGESGLEIAAREGHLLEDVRRRLGRRLHALGEHVVVEHRRVRRHRLAHVDHVRQHLVVDLDQVQRLLGDGLRGRRHRGHGMAVVERLPARHDVLRHVAVVDRHLARRHPLVGNLGHLVAGDDGLHAGQRARLRRVDGADARVGVGAAEDAPHQHARQR